MLRSTGEKLLRSILVAATVILPIAVLILSICLYETNKTIDRQEGTIQGLRYAWEEARRGKHSIASDLAERCAQEIKNIEYNHRKEVKRIERHGFDHRAGIDEQTKQW